MKIRTGYFAYQKRYEQMGYVCISIARYKPKWFKGDEYLALAPSETLLSDWKRGSITEQEYKDTYAKETLAKLDFNTMMIELRELSCGNPVVLLCCEIATDFCHRHESSRFIRHHGIDCFEIEIVKK